MNNNEGENILCATPYPVLQKILKYLPPIDVIRLSQTCKKLRQNLPFYFIITGHGFKKKGPHGGHFCPEKWFDGPKLNKLAEYIIISMRWKDQGWGNRKGKIWLRIIRGSELVLETDPWLCGLANHDWEEVTIPLTEEDDIVKKFKPGDHFQIMRDIGGGGGHHLMVRKFKLVIKHKKNSE